jgi:hypothetical protein
VSYCRLHARSACGNNIYSEAISATDHDLFSVPDAVKVLLDDYNRREFVPIMEADWQAYLYHLALQTGMTSKVHVQTRVTGQPNELKYDFVIGSERAGRRPTVDPDCVCEIKCFVRGFDFQQCQAHVSEVIHRDLPKLAKIKELTDQRYELLFDEINHLAGGARLPHRTKLDRIVSQRDRLDKGIALLVANPEAGLLHIRTI